MDKPPTSAPKDVSKAVFTQIYATGEWGASDNPEQVYFSGLGSHDPGIVEPYCRAISQLLTLHKAFTGRKPDVVDLGCGDFAVGAQLRAHCGNYVACDIVEPLIEYNKRRFAALAVDFRVLDIVEDPPPEADIVFVRQVFQHLSNAQIMAALKGMAGKYKYLVLTEHLPREPFVHNLDIPEIGKWRVSDSGGVVVTSAPFHLAVEDEIVLLECPDDMGAIQTKFYKLK